MDSPELTRRKVLAGLAVGGSSGILVGSGTAALFTDEETFANNGIVASKSISGVVNLAVEVESDDEGLKYTLTLPSDVNNNPSYIWVRTKECPKPVEPADDVKVTLTATCGTGDTILFEDRELLSVLNDLREGRLLCRGDAPCLQPGDSRTLTLEVTEVEDDFEDDDGQLSFQLEFYGQQCRYVPEAENPFGSDSILSECPSDGSDKAISWIAFCSRSGDSLDPEITDVLDRDDEGDPSRVTWETDNDVDYVAVKSGQNFTIYDYSDENGTTSGTAESGDDEGDAAFSGSAPNNSSSTPCELAADKLGDPPFPDGGTSVKLEYCDSDFKEEEECDT